jgi:hypothetical protein
MDTTLFHVKHFVRSKTADGLILEQLKNNLRAQKCYTYHDIVHDGEYFYAFYLDDAKDRVRVVDNA